VDVREPVDRFLIVCEGAKTEPNYFRGFRVPGLVLEVEGAGDNTLGVVRRALELMEEGAYEQVWCVFDRDSFPAGRFNEALTLATRSGIKVAYSNEAFELWYLLHFHYYNTGISRHDYIDRLSAVMGKKYEKGSRSIYMELLARQPHALKHATRLLAQYDPCAPERDNPSTTVHLLVQELNNARGRFKPSRTD
jgi:hypothetical protein